MQRGYLPSKPVYQYIEGTIQTEINTQSALQTEWILKLSKHQTNHQKFTKLVIQSPIPNAPISSYGFLKANT